MTNHAKHSNQVTHITYVTHVTHRNLVCLCPRCRQNFLATGTYSLRRVRFPQDSRDTCTYCQTRYGYDYYVEPRTRAATI